MALSKDDSKFVKSRFRKGRFFLPRYSVELVTFGFLLIAFVRIFSLEPSYTSQSIIALCGLATVAIAYSQWIAIRQEISFDKYYDRLGIVSTKHDKWREEATKLKPHIRNRLEWNSCSYIPHRGFDYKSKEEMIEDHYHMAFVFAELDVLEYVLAKWELGYIQEDLLNRVLRSFDARCEERRRFCVAVLWAVGEEEDADAEGKPHAPAFHLFTREVARRFATKSKYLPDNYLPSLVRSKKILENKDKSWYVPTSPQLTENN